MDARSEASRTAGAVSVMTAEDVIDFTRILAQALGEIRALREDLEPALHRLEDVRLSAEQSAAFSQLGEASERHVLPPLSPDRAEAHGRRDDDVSGWATGANPDAPGAFRAGAGTAGTPAREPVTSNQNESPSMPVPSPGPSSAMQAVEHGEGPSKTGAGDSDSPGMPPKPGPNPRPPSAKASPNTGEPSRPATRESAGRAVAEAEADAQEGGASQSPGARDAPGEAGLTGQESEIFSIEPSLAVAEESSGALAPSDALGERTRRAADLVAKIDGAMAEALARAAQGVTADISLSSSAWSIKMGLDRTQAALLRLRELEADLRFRAESILSVNVPALLDSKPFAVSMAKDTRGLPAAVRAKQRPAAAATGALPPIKQAPSRLEAAQHREAARRYVEDMLGVRLPTDHWDRVGRVTRLPVDIASAAEVATLPTAPPEWRGRPRGWEGAGPGEGQGSVVRTRLRDMQSRRMRLAPLGTGAMGVTPSSATGDTGVLAPWDREWSAAPPSAPSVASLRAALRPPLDSFDSERPSSARPASRGADGRSSKEPLADRQSRPSTASQGRRMSSEKGDKGTDAPTETGKADTGPQAADVGGEDSVARDVLRLGKVAGTGKPMRPMTIPKQLWEEATTSAHSTSAAGEKPQNVLVKIFNGTIVEDQAFAVFYTGNQHRWNPIAVLLLELEEWCGRMNIRRAYVDSSVLVPLALATIAKGSLPHPMDLMACIANVQDLEEQLKLPGWRFRRTGGMELAAAEIQKWWRGYWTRRLISVWHRAARAVQTQWRLSQVRKRTKQIILEVRERRDDAFGKIQSRFRQRWKDIKGGPHVVIHLPSVSLANKDLLEGQSHWETRQNLHMTRLTDLMDDNVDVVYICPHDNVPDMDAYWSKLLQIGGVQNPGARFRIIVPENASILPAHMSLTSKLIFSPKALARIKFFVGSRPAYIVPGSLGKEDIDLSVALGFPILGPHPMRAIGLKMRSRRRKILRTSQVNTAPGVELKANFFLRGRRDDDMMPMVNNRQSHTFPDKPNAPVHQLRELLSSAQAASFDLSRGKPSPHDILKISEHVRRLLYHENMTFFDYALANAKESLASMRDLLDELRFCYPVMTPSEILAGELAVLMVQHPHAPRWLLKLDDECGGRGFAYLDVKGDKDLSRELQRVTEADQARDFTAIMDILSRAQAATQIAQLLERVLPASAVVCSEVYGRWGQYAETFIRRGGVIEAVPVQVVGSPTVSMIVAPTGDVTVLSTAEMVFCPAYRCIGSSFPQQSVPPAALADASEAIGRSLYRSGVTGMVSVSYVALREKGMMRLWGVDFDVSYTPALCAFRLFHFLVDGEFSRRAGAYLAQEGSHFDAQREDDAQSGMAGALPDTGQSSKLLVRRCFVALDMVAHPVLRMTKFPDLFAQLRESGLCFDMVRKLGVTFNIMDSHTSGCIGCLAVGVTPYDAFLEIKNFLDFVHRHATKLKVAGPHMPDPIAREDVQAFLQQHAAFKFLAQHVKQRAPVEQSTPGTSAASQPM